ncbi:helix-turn-helix transcriptional regulator [Sphingomonas lycopersici]|uniref:Helix-turn-helix transcriptional regulator n=1 Tax=Sphingomonas lycopersici TaxID=2951807 RepID=A0AA42CNJ5_9SPHN|nr:helix-turn-helix transcriptional regulator [Sphingomonas lycopersici]MCW6533645.1 helix-turn-helix transcriptional regulator [Sphingomonas lycopersici]
MHNTKRIAVLPAAAPLGAGARSVRAEAVTLFSVGRAAPVWDFDRPATPGSRAVIVNFTRCYVRAHIARPITVAEVATILGLSEAALRRAIVKETGERFARFVLDLRLDQARAWLSTNRESRSIAQIAAALGYRSQTAFSRSYRHRFGEAMSETRKHAVKLFEMREV